MSFFTVVIPTYNRAKFLGETINSVLHQIFTDFELIVVDDGSLDNTKEIISSINDARLKYFYKDNNERGAARNYGFKKSKGKYVIFLDSDDVFAHNHLMVLHKYLSNSEETFICTKYDFKFENGNKGPSSMETLPAGYYNYLLFLKGNPLGCNICVLRKSLNLVLFREEHELSAMEDWIFMIENLQENKLRLLDEVTVTMKDHPCRSMQANHNNIIVKRKNATEYLLHNVNLSKKESIRIRAHSCYFCAIHQYIDGERKEGLWELLCAIKLVGLNVQFMSLFIKLVIGSKWIKSLKNMYRIFW